MSGPINEDIRNSIDILVSKLGKKDNARFLKEAFHSIAKIAINTDDINAGDWKLLSRAIKEFQKSFHVFSPYRGIRKVCIFGSARTPEEDPEYKLTELFSKRITEEDMMVITGAGPGIMEAGNKGALPDKSFGVNIRLPFEQEANQYILEDPKLISYRYFFIRKLMFIKESDATVLFPGGFGTLDEGYEGLTLLQTGKSAPRPVILMESKGGTYWERWISFFSEVMLPLGYISPDDLSLFKIINDVEEAVTLIKHFYSRYHSIRYVKEDTIIRMNSELTESQVHRLNDDFSDILQGKTITITDPLDEEVATKDFLRKPRLKVPFNKVHFGRLVQLIHAINNA